MFGARSFAAAIQRFESRAGRSGVLVGVDLLPDAATFLYMTGARQRQYTVTVAGTHPRVGFAFAIGETRFRAANVHPGVPSALIAQIRRRQTLDRFRPLLIGFGAIAGQRLSWEVTGETRSQLLNFTADDRGRHLRLQCAMPRPKRHQAVGC